MFDNGQLFEGFALAQRHRPSEHCVVLRQIWSFLQKYMVLPSGLFGAALMIPLPRNSRRRRVLYLAKEELVVKLWEQEHFREYFDLDQFGLGRKIYPAPPPIRRSFAQFEPAAAKSVEYMV